MPVVLHTKGCLLFKRNRCSKRVSRSRLLPCLFLTRTFPIARRVNEFQIQWGSISNTSSSLSLFTPSFLPSLALSRCSTSLSAKLRFCKIPQIYRILQKTVISALLLSQFSKLMMYAKYIFSLAPVTYTSGSRLWYHSLLCLLIRAQNRHKHLQQLSRVGV